MPDIGYSPAIRSDTGLRYGCMARRAVLAAAMVAGAALAAHATPAEQAAHAVQAAGPALTRLLRAMASLKLLFAAGLLAAVYWRLAVAASPWRLAGYAAAGAAMSAGPVLIWDMVHIRLGVLLLHGGLLGGLLLLCRDRAMGARLADLVASRRSISRGRG